MSITAIPTKLAWQFTHLLPGTFRRNKADFAHHQYPIVAPLPSRGSGTEPRERTGSEGPFLYFVVDDLGRVCYVGKSHERNVLRRWIRPGSGGPSTHYWTHSTKSGGAVFKIAEGLRLGRTYELRYATLTELSRVGFVNLDASLELAELQAITSLRPAWNAA